MAGRDLIANLGRSLPPSARHDDHLRPSLAIMMMRRAASLLIMRLGARHAVERATNYMINRKVREVEREVGRDWVAGGGVCCVRITGE